jgi:hypothetical protein
MKQPSLVLILRSVALALFVGGSGFYPGRASTPSHAAAALGAGSVLYQADWSHGLDGWGTPPQQPSLVQPPPHDASDWYAAGGLLLSRGAALVSDIAAPYQPGRAGIADYVIETQIQLRAGNYIGISVRREGGDGYAGIVTDMGSGFRAYIWRQDTGELASAPFNPGSAWHAYRLQAQGDTLTFSIDGNALVSANDSRWSSGGWTGLYEFSSQLAVRSFVITGSGATPVKSPPAETPRVAPGGARGHVKFSICGQQKYPLPVQD